MNKEVRNLLQEYSHLLDKQEFNPKDLNYELVDYHLKLLKSIDVVDNGCLSVFDLYQRKHVYYSEKYLTLLGWDPKIAESDISYTNSLIHPEDLPELFRAGIFYMRMGFAMDDRRFTADYKTIFDYRVKGKNGKYVRIIEQQLPLEFDSNGNVWLALSMVDLSPDNNIHMPFRGRLKNHRTGDLYFFPPEDHDKVRLNLTKREKEVLSLIASGLISKEIADKLYISVNTVNTHRQRIIEKLNVNNTYEAIRYAHERGLFEVVLK